MNKTEKIKAYTTNTKNLFELYKEELYSYSVTLEKKQNNYIKNLQNLKNVKTGEVITLQSSYDAKQKAYIKTIEQKVNALVALAKHENLIPLFLTLTLPSKYHPFKTLKNGKIIPNKNYKFEKLENAIIEGYQELKNIYRTFYKRVKNNSKNLYFIKVTECHKSLIPHMHVMLFVESNQINTTKKLFFKVCKENKLQRVEFDESLMTENINNAVGYIMKYILKTLNSNDEFFNRWQDGWRKKHKIRACELSNLPISIEVYKKLYYNLAKEEKENIQKEIEESNQSFFEYFINNSEVHTTIYKEDEMSD